MSSYVSVKLPTKKGSLFNFEDVIFPAVFLHIFSKKKVEGPIQIFFSLRVVEYLMAMFSNLSTQLSLAQLFHVLSCLKNTVWA